MASVRNLKKDINYVLGDLIDSVYFWEMSTGNANSEAGTEIIDGAIAVFDELMAKVNQKDVEDKKAHFKALRGELEEKAIALVEKINALAA
ncbi:hypothetical protein [Sediminicola luteus]|jgi:hypothetical protein|uniref:Uncharacterized protein n=1 Tax=Sediminicola luteus TaxID=319238 RepID=A0A2A4G716_9FLAO|nr:hypothetical protein [Sediminicola luteus]PCE63532.1 hypothetical protein B7P33_15140 [Sediminicola luteus]